MTSPSTTKTNPRVIALIAAAGQGTRLGAEVPKAYVELRGRTLLERSVRALLASGVVDEVIVLVSPDMEPEAARIIGRLDTAGAKSATNAAPIRLVHGGSERADSVWAGLQAIPDDDAVVLIHDAARALTPPAMVRGVAKRVLEGAPALLHLVQVLLREALGALLRSLRQLRGLILPHTYRHTELQWMIFSPGVSCKL